MVNTIKSKIIILKTPAYKHFLFNITTYDRCVANAATIKLLSNDNNSSSTIVKASQPPKELMTKIANLPTTVDMVCISNSFIKLEHMTAINP